MSNSAPASDTGKRARPREVTFAGVHTIVGSVIVIIVLISAESQLNTSLMRDRFTDLLADPSVRALDITLNELRTLMHYLFMVMGVMAVTSLVLGFYVLRRHAASRLALTVLGGVVTGLCVFAGPPGWILGAYIAVGVVLLWTKAATAWFKGEPPVPPAPQWSSPGLPPAGPPPAGPPPAGPPPLP